MSRDIKFRAWSIREQRMIHLATSESSSTHLQLNNHTWGIFEPDLEDYCGGCTCNKLQDDILMQYTGLNDKRDVEIYEGDIVKQTFNVYQGETDYHDSYSLSGNDIGEVIILPSKGVCIKNIVRNAIENEDEKIVNQKLKYYKNIVGYRCEVIGNIYENASLLEGGAE